MVFNWHSIREVFKYEVNFFKEMKLSLMSFGASVVFESLGKDAGRIGENPFSNLRISSSFK